MSGFRLSEPQDRLSSTVTHFFRMSQRNLFVTTALPYANGAFHIGHIMEYIQADIWVRHERRSGTALRS